MPGENSNASRPIPRADTGSRLLNWLSDTSLFLLHLERRIDPWVRPLFDVFLRDPIARFVTLLINLQRRNAGLKIAEEKPLPNEDQHLRFAMQEVQVSTPESLADNDRLHFEKVPVFPWHRE